MICTENGGLIFTVILMRRLSCQRTTLIQSNANSQQDTLRIGGNHGEYILSQLSRIPIMKHNLNRV